MQNLDKKLDHHLKYKNVQRSSSASGSLVIKVIDYCLYCNATMGQKMRLDVQR